MKKLTIALLIAAAFAGCCRKSDAGYEWAAHAIQVADSQLGAAAAIFADSTVTPRSIKDGVYKTADAWDWTSGFFPGSLWLCSELYGDKAMAAQARIYTSRLDTVQHYTGNHDIGFMMMCSYGNELRIEGDTSAKQVLINSANSLLERYDSNVGLIRSWDFGEWNYPVIIDNMMNLELLFWASEQTGDPKYREVAISHADNTMANHFRPDNSSYHVVSYNDDGTVESRGTFQGYADSSAWARGQAWGLYGYTMCYRCTGEERYLDQARRIAAYIMAPPAATEDLIPYWDYNAPGIPDVPRDASAAAIAASALVELSGYVKGEESASYMDFAGKTLENLSSPAYLATPGSNGLFILMHSTGHLPGNSEIDTPLNYADYYFLEGIQRYLAAKKVNPLKLK